MTLISLNTWGCRGSKQKLVDFFHTYKNVDIFCLQEMWMGPYENLEGRLAGGRPLLNADIKMYVPDISHILSRHAWHFHPSLLERYGLCIFVKKDIAVLEEGDTMVHGERGYLPEEDLGLYSRNLQYVTVQTGKGPRTVLNFHGLWNGKGKGDSGDRLRQSDKITEFLGSLSSPCVLSGDFNLLPDTESLKKLEASGLRNLIREYGITSTRTSLYTKPEKFADYTFVSQGIKVKDFKILPDEVSDHAAMYLEFE